MSTATLQTRTLAGPDGLGRERWNELVLVAGTPSPYMTWELQTAWAETCDEGTLHYVAAERGGEVVAVAPLHARGGWAELAGTCFEFDRLDFVGDVSDADVLTALLEAGRNGIEDFSWFDFEFIPDDSPTTALLPVAAERLGLRCAEQYEMVAAEIDLAGGRADALAAANRPRVLKDERWLMRHGRLEVHHFRETAEILPQLPELFAQHERRWQESGSRFREPHARRLYERLTEHAAGSDLLRFTRMDLDGRPVGFHYGLALAGRYFFGVFSFEPELAQRSPGRVLLRHVVLAALDEGAVAFDFGTGRQDFKLRYATAVTRCRTWALEPPEWEA